MTYLAVRLPLSLPALLLSMALATPTSIYDHPLSSKAIREAYFLGQRSDEKVTDFLAQYIKRPPIPDKGPYISEISLYTPYAQVVLRSWRNKVGYSAQQAQQDFLSHSDMIRVKVRIEFTATYSALQGTKPDKNVEGEQALILRPKDFWRDGALFCIPVTRQRVAAGEITRRDWSLREYNLAYTKSRVK